MTTIRGKDHYFGPYDLESSKTKFRKLLGEYLLSNQSPTFNAPVTGYSMSGVSMAYLRFAESYYSGSSEYVNLELAMNPISELYADHPATKFGPKEYRACREWWVRRGVSRQYANKQTKRLKRMLKWAVGESLLPADSLVAIQCVEPLKRGRTTAKETPPILPVPAAIVNATLPHLSKVVADMVRLQRLLGSRPGEVCKLTPSMVDRTNEVWEIHLEEHKTAHKGKSRVIYVGPKAQDILRPYLLRAGDAFCFSPKEATKQRLEAKRATRVTPESCGNKPGSNVVRNPRKEPGDSYDTQAYGHAIKYGCRKAWPAPKGLLKPELLKWRQSHSWAPNQLRHSAGTDIRRQFGLEAASVILGHSEVGVTQIYAEADRAKAIEIVGRVG